MIERVLAPTSSSDTVMKTPYEVQICTSDIEHAGTKAPVAMTVYGKDVITGETIQRAIDFFDEAGNDFLSRGHGTAEGVLPDVTQKEIEDFGEPFKLTVALDPKVKRSRASWHLDRVLLINKQTGLRYDFPCQKWFCNDKSRDDGQMTRPLELGEISEIDGETQRPKSRSGSIHLDRVKYIVRVETGDIYQAGTDSKVYITLFGEHGDTGERPLIRKTQVKVDDDRMHRDLFERNHTDSFVVEDLDLGMLSKINVRHDNSSWKKSWYLDKVVVEVEDGEGKWTFPCQQWFSKKKGDKRIDRDIPIMVDPARLTRLCDDAQAEVDRLQTEVDALDAEPALTGEKKTAHDHKRQQLAALEHKLDDLQRQLATQVDGVSTRGELVTYEVTVKTGNKPKSGTTSDVSIQLMGHSSSSRRTRRSVSVSTPAPDAVDDESADTVSISSSHVVPTSTALIPLMAKSDSFAKNSTAVFSVDGIDVGDLVEVRIGHDDKSPGAAWFLENVAVRINRPKVGIDPNTYHFPCNSWLSTNSTWKTLLADSVSESSEGGAIVTAATATPGDKAQASGHTYRIEVLTGDVDRAGTDARVSLVLTGVLGESPPLKLRESTTFRDKFERGHTDVFIFNDVDDLGKLTQARIWHNNHGLGPSWFLEHVTVFDQTTESKFEFPCNKWLSKSHEDKLLERVLPCEEYVMNGFVVGYDVELKAADGASPCTVAPIVMLVGDDRASAEIELGLPPSGALEGGQSVVHARDLPALGNVLEACIKLPPQLRGDATEWDLEHVKITERRLGTVWTFPCDVAVQYGGPFVRLRQSAVRANAADPAQGGELVTYEVRTTTSSMRGAGTDAKVHVTIWGRRDEQVLTTGLRHLKISSSFRDKFEKGHEDIFKIEAMDLGKLEKLRIEHDASGWKVRPKSQPTSHLLPPPSLTSLADGSGQFRNAIGRSHACLVSQSCGGVISFDPLAEFRLAPRQHTCSGHAGSRRRIRGLSLWYVCPLLFHGPLQAAQYFVCRPSLLITRLRLLLSDPGAWLSKRKEPKQLWKELFPKLAEAPR
jgi:hypothetical protein